LKAVRCRIIVSFLLTAAFTTLLFAEHLRVRVEADRLRLSAPQLHFLTGRPLDRLHNGATVTYRLELTVRNDRGGRHQSRVVERFKFSYDIWEERVTVTRLGTPTRSASNLSIVGAEAWCLDNLSLSAAELPKDRQFWVALEYQSEEPKETAASEDSGLTLSSLIDIFSRRSRDEQQVRGVDEAGPFRLDDLKKNK
jgi:hypothetical protein